jgi:hypothetical protein
LLYLLHTTACITNAKKGTCHTRSRWHSLSENLKKMKLNQKQINYYKNWESRRKNKLKYLLTEGMLYWALPFSIFMILFELSDNRFVFSIKILKDFITIYLISSVLGILTALFSFKNIDKKYLDLKKKSII